MILVAENSDLCALIVLITLAKVVCFTDNYYPAFMLWVLERKRPWERTGYYDIVFWLSWNFEFGWSLFKIVTANCSSRFSVYYLCLVLNHCYSWTHQWTWYSSALWQLERCKSTLSWNTSVKLCRDSISLTFFSRLTTWKTAVVGKQWIILLLLNDL